MRAGINYVAVKLDPPNDRVKLKSGIELFVDTTFEPEKHVQIMGEVVSLPLQLRKGVGGMEWTTKNELRIGDRVAMYYLAVLNCLSKEQRKYIKDGDSYIIFIRYHNIYAVIREKEIKPVNGFILAEPLEDPEYLRVKAEYEKKGIILPDLRRPPQKEVTYAKIAYVGEPVTDYEEPHLNLSPGDEVMMEKVRDIPIEYEYHTKMDGGKKYYRIRRKDIIAKL